MLIAALRDLQWRRRRFIIAIIGTGVVFAMTLILTGLVERLRSGSGRHGQGDERGRVDHPVGRGRSVPRRVAVPGDGRGGRRAALDGVTKAAPLVFSGTTMRKAACPRTSTSSVRPPTGPGMPDDLGRARRRRPPTRSRSAARCRKDIGDRVELGADTLKVVGIVNDSTALAGTPNVFLTTRRRAEGDVRESAGRVVDRRDGQSRPTRRRDTRSSTQDDAVADMLRPMQSSHSAISFLAILLWIVAALIVGSVIYLSALERVRDFAVFKAVGVSTRSVMAGLALQAVIVAVVAALVGGVLSFVLGPTFPMKVVIPDVRARAAPRHRDLRRPRREHRGAAPRGHRRSRARVRRALTVPGPRDPRPRRRVRERRLRGAPDRRPRPRRARRQPRDPARTERLREDDAALVPRRHPVAHVGPHHVSVTRRSPVSTAGPWRNYRRHTVGIVFQAFNLVPSLTALENVMVPLRAAGIPRARAQATGRGAPRRRSACRTG